MMLVQNRNRRTGLRRTLQIAEVTEGGDASVLMQFDIQHDSLAKVNEPRRIYETLGLYTGMSASDIARDLDEKVRILKWFVKNNISDVHQIGVFVAKNYAGKFKV
ncbi:hypothetical protein HYV82_01385 [Candidatus Woesearchaeota archaeon]|nr:hypothetical protein [Candidatus Woesearchaeota archaeon]